MFLYFCVLEFSKFLIIIFCNSCLYFVVFLLVGMVFRSSSRAFVSVFVFATVFLKNLTLSFMSSSKRFCILSYQVAKNVLSFCQWKALILF